MKIPKKIEIGSHIRDTGTTPSAVSYESYEYAHNDFGFAKTAGHVFNEYLSFEITDLPGSVDKNLLFRFQSIKPDGAFLYAFVRLSGVEMAQNVDPNHLKQIVCEDAVRGIIEGALEAVNIKHKLEASFWQRIKFVFTKKIS